MVFKANCKKDRKLKTRVPLLLLISLVMPVVSKDNNSDLTSMPIASLTIRYCGHVLLATHAKNNEVHMSSKFRNINKDSMLVKRNNDIKILKRVRTQLKVARNHFRNNREIIAQLYSDVKTVMQTNYHYAWLPSQPSVWYKKYIEKLDKDTKVLLLLPALRDSLHNFSVTLDQMRKFNETHMFNYTTRKHILDDLSKNLIAVLCEVETALVSLSLWHDKKVPDSTRTVIMDGLSWDANPDHTTMLIQDWGVLTIYYRFLKEWLYISRRMVQDQMSPWSVVSETTVMYTSTNMDDETSDTGTTIAPTEQPLPLPCIRHACHSLKHRRRKSLDSIT